jgi:hypothetical protein
MAMNQSRARPTPTNALLVATLNEMIDLREKQQATFENVVPQSVILFLLILAPLVVGVIGYMNGVHGVKRLPLSILFSVVVAMTLFIILDLDRPRRGVIRVGHESFRRLQQSIDSSK